jgi:hypothetical protein
VSAGKWVFFKFLGVGWDWVHLVRRAIFGLVYQPRMIDDECGVVGGMKIWRGNRSTQRKSAPVPLCPPQIPHDLTWDRTRAPAVGSRRLTAWAMARPGTGISDIPCWNGGVVTAWKRKQKGLTMVMSIFTVNWNINWKHFLKSLLHDKLMT